MRIIKGIVAVLFVSGYLSCAGFLTKENYDYSDQDVLMVSHDVSADWKYEKNKTYGLLILSNENTALSEAEAGQLLRNTLNGMSHQIKTMDPVSVKSKIRTAGGGTLLLQIGKAFKDGVEFPSSQASTLGKLVHCDYIVLVRPGAFSYYDTIRSVPLAESDFFEGESWPAFSIDRHHVSSSGNVYIDVVNVVTGEVKYSKTGSASSEYDYDTEEMFSRNRSEIRRENHRRLIENRRRERIQERKRREEEKEREKRKDRESGTEAALDLMGVIFDSDSKLSMIDENRSFSPNRYKTTDALNTDLFRIAVNGSLEQFDTLFDGQTISGNTVNGTGTFEFNDGRRYAGQWKDGKADGPGTFTYSEAISYKGSFAAGYASGRGLYVDTDGNTYDGGYSAGMKNGKGIYTVNAAPYLRLDSSGKVYRWKTRHLEEGVIPMKDGSGMPYRELEIGNVYEVECRNGVYIRMQPYKGNIEPGR